MCCLQAGHGVQWLCVLPAGWTRSTMAVCVACRLDTEYNGCVCCLQAKHRVQWMCVLPAGRTRSTNGCVCCLQAKHRVQ